MILIRHYQAILAYTRLDEDQSVEEERVHLGVYKIALQHCESATPLPRRDARTSTPKPTP
jgi:hypothetical protein